MSDKGKKDLSGHFRPPVIKPPFSALFGKMTQESWPKRTKAQEDELLSMARRSIGSRYLVKDIKIDETGIFAKVLLQPDENSRMFEDLRMDLKGYNLYPRLAKVEDQYVIAIYPKPSRKPSSYTVNLIMFIATLVTTVWAGAMLWASRSGDIGPAGFITVLLDPVDVAMGALTFAFPLILILGSHELGHYFTSRAYRVDASLPYFIPIPPLISPFGTFGALISMKENISNRKALVDIGAAGPIAGFVVAIPVTIIGLLLTEAYPAQMGDLVDGDLYMIINPPLLFNMLASLLGVGSDGVIFPTALAGWIGLFVTALNLFPVGQLDGGHIVRGVFGNSARFISYATVAIMVFLGLTTGFTTYLLFAVLILMLGARHPPPLDDISPVRPRQYIVFGLAVLMMVLTFHPVPLEAMEYKEGEISVIPHHDDLMVDHSVPGIFTITVSNVGSRSESVDLTIWEDGNRVLPTTIVEPPSALVMLVQGDPVHASYSMDGFTLYLLDPIGRELPKGDVAQWRIASLGGEGIPGVASVEARFVTESGLKESVDIDIVGPRDGIHLDRTRMDLEDLDHTVRGWLVIYDLPGGKINISIDHGRSSEGFRVFFTPYEGTGEWVVPLLGYSMDISPGKEVEMTIDGTAGSDLVMPFVIEANYIGSLENPRLEMTINAGIDLSARIAIYDM